MVCNSSFWVGLSCASPPVIAVNWGHTRARRRQLRHLGSPRQPGRTAAVYQRRRRHAGSDPALPRLNRTAYYWHIHIEGIELGQRYAYRIQGPWRPYYGTRFDADKVLLDPYGRSIELGANYDRWAAARPGSNLAVCAKNRVVDTRHYDWEGDKLPALPLPLGDLRAASGGFTKSPSSGSTPPCAAPTSVSSRRSLTCNPSASPRSSCCRCSSSILRIPQGALQLLGLQPHVVFFAPTPSTPAARILSPSFATWSRRCTGPTSR